MRLFVAAELPEQMVEALGETSALLRACVRGRYVAPDSFHVTLAFLGDVEGYRMDDVVDALDDGCRGATRFRAALGELGSFGRRSKATLWQGFAEPGLLPDLALGVRASLRSRSFAFDDKKFLPHVTLMRAADLTAGTLAAPVLAEGEIDAITLFSSDLAGPRPLYEPIHTAHLL